MVGRNRHGSAWNSRCHHPACRYRLQLARTLYEISVEISSGKKQARDLASYVESTVVLQDVSKVLSHEENAITPLLAASAISTAKNVVARYKEDFRELAKWPIMYRRVSEAA
ncbi:hypothetical protein N7488_009174 [Penicillium malachiteum]|nr:hypothetical protein N7488_009174 [Penicillium malachiteum]